MAASEVVEIAGEEKYSAEKTLICLLHACKGSITTVELRDESALYGRIAHVDGFMNIRMLDVTLTKTDGRVLHFDEIFVQGEKIRFVQIPDEIDIRRAIFQQLNMISRTKNPPMKNYKRGRGRGRGFGRGFGRGRGKEAS